VSDLLLRGVRRIGTSGAPCDVLVLDGQVASVTPVGVLDVAVVTAGVPDLEIVAAPGAWVGPGLWDHHVHFDQWSLVRRRIDVGDCASAEAVARRIADAMEPVSPATNFVIAHGYRDGLWPSPAHRTLLDTTAPGLPIVVISQDLHAVWCSTAALRALGRSETAHPDGVLREQDAFDVTAAVSAVPDEQLDAWVADAADAAAARGVVGIVDLEMRFGLDRWRRRVHQGTDELRVRSGVYPDELDAVLDRELRSGQVIDGTRGLVAMGPFKLITDGSLGTRTAAVDEPYEGAAGTGLLAYAFDESVELVRRAVDGGLDPAVHAIGDRANAMALDVFEATGTRGSIEHAQLLRTDDIERFARLGVTASVQPAHAVDDRDLADLHWAGRTDRAYPFRSLVDAGARLVFGSDAPVAPLDPWATMAAAVARTDDDRPAWHAEQRLDVLAAWRASTDGRVSLAVGDVADLVVTAEDPLADAAAGTDGADLRTMPVLATAVGGRLTFSDL
jgi:predicted amidohydrolase YtcJ